jgi:transcriptional regulatory protein GAL4
VFETLTSQTTSLPIEIPHPTVYTSLICQSQFHLITNNIHHCLISNISPSAQELLAHSSTINAWEESIPSYLQLDSPDIQSDETFLFARYRLSWRSWNMKIILFRPVVLQWAARRQKLENGDDSETSEEFECRKRCIEAANATINSVSNFVAKNMISRLSTWYMLFFLFQAGLVPIICLTTDPTHPDCGIWLNDILTTKSLLSHTAATNRLAARCLSVFSRILPMLESDSGVLDDVSAWDGNFNPEWQNDQLGAEFGIWDWANSEMNWTL